MIAKRKKRKDYESEHDMFLHVVVRDGGHVTADAVVNGYVLARTRRGGDTTQYTRFSQILRAVERLPPGTRIHIQGGWQTAPLLCRLFEDSEIPLFGETGFDPGGIRIMIGGPLVFGGQTDPPSMLSAMSRCGLQPSMGGWHTASLADRSVYRLIRGVLSELTGVDDDDGIERLQPLLEAHPAWAALGFIPTLHRGCALQMLACLVDPRWHINPDNPDSISHVSRFMGWHRLKAVSRAFHRGSEITVGYDTPDHRAGLWLAAWNGPDEHQGDVEPGTHPRDFLRRLSPLRASLSFLSFVVMVWLDRVVGSGQRLFVPGYFFDTDEAILAWNKHLRSTV